MQRRLTPLLCAAVLIIGLAGSVRCGNAPPTVADVATHIITSPDDDPTATDQAPDARFREEVEPDNTPDNTNDWEAPVA